MDGERRRPYGAGISFPSDTHATPLILALSSGNRHENDKVL